MENLLVAFKTEKWGNVGQRKVVSTGVCIRAATHTHTHTQTHAHTHTHTHTHTDTHTHAHTHTHTPTHTHTHTHTPVLYTQPRAHGLQSISYVACC